MALAPSQAGLAAGSGGVAGDDAGDDAGEETVEDCVAGAAIEGRDEGAPSEGARNATWCGGGCGSATLAGAARGSSAAVLFRVPIQ